MWYALPPPLLPSDLWGQFWNVTRGEGRERGMVMEGRDDGARLRGLIRWALYAAVCDNVCGRCNGRIGNERVSWWYWLWEVWSGV